ncbi:MAG: 2-C-methyl-D-erythritol 2,4-cyclodiphosphate synthase [Chloroflexi bacterium]|nr:2-C-methyl-D-erythritol 2,4-cyclodiphosphate synthase [Chloroflexota bacterium]
MRVGVGYDVHGLVTGRGLILGGVRIPYSLGLAGHSDADVLIHAIIDALLGAAALKDIGAHFPPGDPQYAGISSLELLRRTKDVLDGEGWQTENVDATIVAEHPKLMPFIDDMREHISEALGVEKGRISVKATTTEGLGFAGRGEGIAAHAVALIERARGG